MNEDTGRAAARWTRNPGSVSAAILVATCGCSSEIIVKGSGGAEAGPGGTTVTTGSPDGASSGSSGGGEGMTSTTGSGNVVCVPGNVISCYSGPAATLGVGVCTGGEATCTADGAVYGPCVGQTTPGAQVCGSGVDGDCDGVASCGKLSQWALVYGGKLADQSENAVAADAAGNVILAGDYYGTVDFGGGSLTAAGKPLVVAKLDPGGSHLWSHGFSATGVLYIGGVAVDATGDVLITGSYGGTVDFGDGPLPTAVWDDGFVVKLSAAGDVLWSRKFGGLGQEWPQSAVVDATGALVVAGFNDGGENAVPGMFLGKFDSAGNPIYYQQFAGDSKAFGLALDATGNAVVTGSYYQSVNFGGGALSCTYSENFFLAKFDPAGQLIWDKCAGGITSGGRAVAVDSAGNLVAAGEIDGDVEFDSSTFSASHHQAFIAHFTSSGDLLNVMTMDGTHRPPFVATLVADAAGNVIAGGQFDETVNIGGVSLTATDFFGDMFLAKIDSSGHVVRAGRFGGPGGQIAYALAVDGGGNLLLSGELTGSINFDDGQPNGLTISSDANANGFVAKLSF